MGSDIFFRADIANILQAMACANEGVAQLALNLVVGASPEGLEQERVLSAYRLGVQHALVSVGLAFGLEPVLLDGGPDAH